MYRWISNNNNNNNNQSVNNHLIYVSTWMYELNFILFFFLFLHHHHHPLNIPNFQLLHFSFLLRNRFVSRCYNNYYYLQSITPISIKCFCICVSFGLLTQKKKFTNRHQQHLLTSYKFDNFFVLKPPQIGFEMK